LTVGPFPGWAVGLGAVGFLAAARALWRTPAPAAARTPNYRAAPADEALLVELPSSDERMRHRVRAAVKALASNEYRPRKPHPSYDSMLVGAHSGGY
jgi:hypothetical protein